MLALTAALVAVALVSVWFSTTRAWAVLAISALCLIHPWFILIVVIAWGWAVFRMFFRKP